MAPRCYRPCSLHAHLRRCRTRRPQTTRYVPRAMPSSPHFPWCHVPCPPHPTSLGATCQVSYPKPPAVATDQLDYGVWSADFSWRRGVVPQCGQPDSRPISIGDSSLHLHRPPPVHAVTRQVLQIGAVAPCTASKPSAAKSTTGGTPRKPPSRKQIMHEIERSAAGPLIGLPFGQRTTTNYDKETHMQARHLPISFPMSSYFHRLRAPSLACVCPLPPTTAFSLTSYGDGVPSSLADAAIDAV